MKKDLTVSATFTNGRSASEKRIDERRKEHRRAGSSPEEMHRLIHEMAIQKFELEMQNEELLQAREELKDGLDRFTRLYDFSPAGYATLARDSTIIEINLTGAGMLGVDRSLLAGDRFGRFIAPDDLAIFNALLDRVFNLKEQGSCDLFLLQSKSSNQNYGSQANLIPDMSEQLKVRIEAIASDDTQECLTVFTSVKG